MYVLYRESTVEKNKKKKKRKKKNLGTIAPAYKYTDKEKSGEKKCTRSGERLLQRTF